MIIILCKKMDTRKLLSISIKNLFAILILSGVLFSSCGIIGKSKKKYDYSQFPQGAILTGDMKDSKTFYLIREDAKKMAGICFIDDDKAVAEIISFDADSTGSTAFLYGKDVSHGKMVVDQSSKEVTITLPRISALAIEPQKIHMNYLDTIPASADCPEYYKEPVFDNIIAAKNIQYGTARGYYNSKPSDYISKEDYRVWFEEMAKSYRESVIEQGLKALPLHLDIYRPANNTADKSPLVLFIHGGAFFFGDKENKLQHILTDDLVKRGFTVASINYRLGSSLVGAGAIERTIYRDVQDARAALRYLIHHREELGIDEEQVYLAGSSAGGIIALTTAFMDENEVYTSASQGFLRLRENLGSLDGSGNDYTDSFNVAGVVSLWGGVTNLQIVNNPIPALLFHGTNDDIVPNGEGLPFRNAMGNLVHRILSTFGKVYGSQPIYNRLTSLNIPAKYVPFEGYGHDAHINPDESLNANMDVIREETAGFLFDHVSKHYFDYQVSGDTIVGTNGVAPVYQLENPGNTSVRWQVVGGFITNQTNASIRVIWYGATDTGTVTACITNGNGMSCKKELHVKISYKQ